MVSDENNISEKDVYLLVPLEVAEALFQERIAEGKKHLENFDVKDKWKLIDQCSLWLNETFNDLSMVVSDDFLLKEYKRRGVVLPDRELFNPDPSFPELINHERLNVLLKFSLQRNIRVLEILKHRLSYIKPNKASGYLKRESYEEDKHYQEYIIRVNPKPLRQLMIQKFSQDEIRNLCFDLGIDYENIPGEDKRSKIRELILSMDRQDKLLQLIIELPKYNPSISFGGLIVKE